MTVLPVGLVADPVAHDFGGIRDHDEGVGIDGVDQLLNPWQFTKGNHRVNDVVRLSRIAAPSLDDRDATALYSRDSILNSRDMIAKPSSCHSALN
jgi:hypothetical protein